MIFDIVVVGIIAISMVLGFRSGFIYTFIHTIGWLLSLFLGIIWSPYVKDFLIENTDFYDSLYHSLLAKFTESLSVSDSSFENLPSIIGKSINTVTSDIASSTAESLATLLFTIISFFIVVFAIKLVLWLLINLLSKKRTDGFTGAIDGILGMVAGMLKGFVLVFILFALLVPVISLASPEFITNVISNMEASTFAKDLYDNNLIMLIFRDLSI